MRQDFEQLFGLAVFALSVMFLALPYFTGEQPLQSLLTNRLALFGAVAIGLLVFFKVRRVFQSKSPVESMTSSPPPPTTASDINKQ
jgi:hypothetical protein